MVAIASGHAVVSGSAAFGVSCAEAALDIAKTKSANFVALVYRMRFPLDASRLDRLDQCRFYGRPLKKQEHGLGRALTDAKSQPARRVSVAQRSGRCGVPPRSLLN